MAHLKQGQVKQSYTPRFGVISIVLIVTYLSLCSNMNGGNVNPSELSITCWNMRGLSTALPYLHKLLENNDIVALSEHWLHSNRVNILGDISNDFGVIARASKYSDASEYGYKRGQGGVALMWRKSLGGVSPLTSIVHDRFCGIRLQCQGGRVLNIFSVYLPSQGSPDDFDTILDDLADTVNGMEEGTKSTSKPNALGRKVMKFFKEYSIFPCNLMKMTSGPVYTFKGGMGTSTIDYIELPFSLEDRVMSSEILSDPILNNSDHYAVRATINIEGLKSAAIPIPRAASVKWNKIKKEILLSKFTEPADIRFDNIIRTTDFTNLNHDDVDSIIDEITTFLVSLDKELPRSKYKPYSRPYWNERLNHLKKEKVESFRLWKLPGHPRDNNSEIWLKYKLSKRNFRRELRNAQRAFEQKEVLDLINYAECDKNRFWRLVKRARNTKHSSTLAIRNPAGRVVHEVDDVVKAWYDHFSTLCSNKPESCYDKNHYKSVTNQVRKWAGEKDLDDFLSEPFSVEEVSKAIYKLNRGKAAGCDSVTAEHLQHAGYNLKALLAYVYNRVVQLEYIPKNFRMGTQIPIYKGKNTCSLDQNNY